jgi:hypothetical protein
MHQSAVEYDVASAAMAVVPSVIAGQGAPGRGFRHSPREEPSTPSSEYPAPGFAPHGRTARPWSYVTAAGIAAGLVAAWLGLCVI